MARLADVARKAGVSISTASYVVTGTRPVGEATRKRVLTAIEETGYTPDAVARALRTARSNVVALVIPNIQNPYFAGVIEGVEAEGRARGQSLLFLNSGEDPAREVDALQELRARRVDGMIIGLTRRTPPDVLLRLQASERPVVFVDRAGPPGCDQVTVANEVGARVMVGHLAAAGHRRIAMVAGVAGISTAEDRLRGYRDGLAAAGLPFDPQLVIEGGSRREVARRAVMTALRGLRPDALVVGNNDMTFGALEAIQHLGMQVPHDLAVVALDDLPWGHLLASPLTAVAQPSFAMGREAMRLLLRRIDAPSSSPRSVRLRPEFVHRASCGCPPASRANAQLAGTGAEPAPYLGRDEPAGT